MFVAGGVGTGYLIAVLPDAGVGMVCHADVEVSGAAGEDVGVVVVVLVAHGWLGREADSSTLLRNDN